MVESPCIHEFPKRQQVVTLIFGKKKEWTTAPTVNGLFEKLKHRIYKVDNDIEVSKVSLGKS